ncbi:hypothetical protein R3W88_016234 [Solanum pinnatisectum]|uniref:CCHC-type domain-containing protein n=1 Tax=Solanum pinnatisectum TaxID=50273 RepID=A0AAV9KWU6_9SOLN|nr:hypothetical protein R3W88_016234 [Solanum pinnatisectum]
MDISHLIIHSQQIEEDKLKESSREAKREKTGDGDFSYLRSNGHGRSRFQQRFSGQGSSNAPTSKFKKDSVSNLKPKRGNGGGNGSSIPTCQKCGKSHLGKCLMGTDNCYGCGKSGHCLRDFPFDQGTDGRQSPPSDLGSSAPKQN